MPTKFDIVRLIRQLIFPYYVISAKSVSIPNPIFNPKSIRELRISYRPEDPKEGSF